MVPPWMTLAVLAALVRIPAGDAAPQRLSRTGLYGPAGGIAPGVLAYAPQYPLWSDGAAKARWVLLPRGAAIDGTDPGAWVFPVGTRFWKEFSFGGRKVETRMLWRSSATTWTYAAYAWRDDQSDADLVGPQGLPRAAEIAPGVYHTIPGHADCRACHENPAPGPLGFDALQLSVDRDSGALHGEPLRPGQATLATLADRGLLRPAPPDLAPRIQAADPRARAALGYLHVNCGSCHREGNPIPHVDLDFRYREGGSRALSTALGRPTHSQLPGRRAGTLAIAPGSPEESLLLARMRSHSPLQRMPPTGTVLVDQEAVGLLTAWIAQGGCGMVPP
ncbi:c-type cytochrome domain-containing protein [Mesoterricola sediminis]|uniref:Cytochrome C Planctomycete-type domain-containing protein n=1 Tax=Mesoterricola sediminis TaxID=2927980 RepID=A0AA48H9T3_9BACT|nr:c-type cytochrome domain-containing protein [Mesoterricola sediminis]BDU78538.1 hypothetical protein METESE_34960 [Mesoterricola sediminis]